MEIITKHISEIIPYENNPRKNDEAVEYVANSIKEFGFKVPVIIDKNNVIVAGHTRVKAAEMLGIEEIPCIMADDLTDEQIKAFRLADNKVGEIADWDFDALDIELDNIDLNMSDFGFNDTDFGVNIDEELLHSEEYSRVHFLISFGADNQNDIEAFEEYLKKEGFNYEKTRNKG